MKYLVTLFLLMFSFVAMPQKKAKNNDYFFLKSGKTTVKNPFQMRDPFKRKRVKHSIKQKTYGKILHGNKFSNLAEIDNYSIDQIRVVGILLGKTRRAIAKVVKGTGLGSETFTLREGMKIGENKAEIKAILPGGIVLVEKIRNVYDQDEYIETIIPITSEL